jgi:hypothetical protein
MAWIAVVPPSPATRTSATRPATRTASGSARPASSRPSDAPRLSGGPSSVAVPSRCCLLTGSWDGTGSHALGVRHRRPPPSRLAGGADSREEWAVSTGNADH